MYVHPDRPGRGIFIHHMMVWMTSTITTKHYYDVQGGASPSQVEVSLFVCCLIKSKCCPDQFYTTPTTLIRIFNQFIGGL